MTERRDGNKRRNEISGREEEGGEGGAKRKGEKENGSCAPTEIFKKSALLEVRDTVQTNRVRAIYSVSQKSSPLKLFAVFSL